MAHHHLGMLESVHDPGQGEYAARRMWCLVEMCIENRLATRVRAIYAALPYGVMVIDKAGRFIELNEPARRLMDVSRAGMRKRTLAEMPWQVIRPDRSTLPLQEWPAVVALTSGQEQRNAIVGFTGRDGAQRWLLVDAIPLRDSAGAVHEVICSFVDITAQHQEAESVEADGRRLSLLYEATMSLAAAEALDDSISTVLRIVCTHLGWDAGLFWGVDASGAILECRGIWHDTAHDLSPLLEASKARTIGPGEGLPGRVWVEGSPCVVADLSEDETLHAHAARSMGLRRAAAFPVQGAYGAHGVMQFFSREHGSLDPELLQALNSLGMQIGGYIERLQAEQALQHQALHDALTNLPNRSLMLTRLYDALRTARSTGASVALILMDLDRFKEVNDTLGHHCGDLLLLHVGAHVSAALHTSDTVARLGGDEFAVLLPETDGAGAITAVEKIRAALAAPMLLDGRLFDVRSSIGVALYPDHGVDAQTLLRCADVAMYAAKRSGGGYAVYDALRDEHSPARLMLESELRQAIVSGELVLHYQPEIDVRAGRIDRVESLVRWPHPVRGLVPPDQFIPLAEEIGLITALTQWVLETALRQCQAWTRTGYELGVAVNLSMRTLHDTSFPDTVVWLLRRYEVDPALLTLEITESALMAKPAQAQAVLTRLAALGVHIAIDDFGTGYSSLAYLKHLPVDEIKIDRSFVRGMTADAKDTAIVASINSLSHHLGLRVVAEGVETAAEWDILADLGCDLVQGYHVSRPLPAARLEEWLASSPWGLPRAGTGDAAV